ncbi:zonular occludens toxin domain-containing protein, partial [Vogesella urethralis]|uniref:zonular occludens toxin domain-containing protein n=1 Tax=Vogesella urethralis TaxID=2592656 RepID=UPI001F0CF735
CQRSFPPRRNGTEIPKQVSKFETHRHHGFDVWLITQSPKLLDTHVREFVNMHYHQRRVIGSPSARVYQWDCCELQPNSRGA